MVYTPVVAVACQQFSHIYGGRAACSSRTRCATRSRRCYGIGPIPTSMSSSSRTASGSWVSVTRARAAWAFHREALALHADRGIHPERTLPIVLDVGTNNAERLKDPEYLGWRHERVTGQAYLDFVDQFVQAVKQELPTTCLQWEDFATPHARPSSSATGMSC